MNRLTEKDDQGTITEIDEHTRHAIDLLKSMQNPLQDYADIVGAPAFAHGCRYVYPEPEDYAIETAIIAEKKNRLLVWLNLKMGSGLMMKRIISAFLHGSHSPHRTDQLQIRTIPPAAGRSRWQARF